MIAPCTCPQVLRISLPPGTAPEQIAVLIERAVRDYLSRRRPWDDFPTARTADEQRAASREVARPYMEAAR
jgi:hypothetical protein